MAADHLRDLARRDPLVPDGVKHRARPRPLERQAVEPCGIEPVHGGPAAGAVRDQAGDLFAPGELDQHRHEAVVALTVHR
jgi:hypothetical protein